MDGDDFVLLDVIRAYGYKIIAFGFLELCVGHFSFKLPPNPEPVLVLLTGGLVKVPFTLLFLTISCLGLTDDFLPNSLHGLRVLPNHKLKNLSVTEDDQIVSVPVNTEDRLFELFREHDARGDSFPDYQKT